MRYTEEYLMKKTRDLTEDRRSLAQFFLESPLVGSGLDLERDRRLDSRDRFRVDEQDGDFLPYAQLPSILKK
jgi:hypothetical protein